MEILRITFSDLYDHKSVQIRKTPLSPFEKSLVPSNLFYESSRI